MKNKKRIAIIGAGFTGLISAYFYKIRGYEVNIFETSKNIGGITNDLFFDNQNFFSGCHQLILSDWLKKINKKNELKLKTYKVHYGNYTEEKKNLSFDWSYPVPTFDRDFNVKNNTKKISSLENRINMYPKDISSFLKKWINQNQETLNLKNLDDKSAYGFALTKIAIKKKPKEIIKLKKKNKFFNELYAIKNFLSNKNQQRCLIPKNGYFEFFKIFYELLIKKKINFFLKSPVRPVWRKNKLYLVLRGKEMEYEKILWTGNPVALIKNFGYEKLDSKYTNIKITCGSLKNKINNCFFIQVYSLKTSISRIYVYKIKNETKFTIENYCNGKDENIILKTKEILSKFKINFDIKNDLYEHQVKRHSLISLKDNKIISKFLKKTKKTNLVYYDWRVYGRDQRINSVIKNIK